MEPLAYDLEPPVDFDESALSELFPYDLNGPLDFDESAAFAEPLPGEAATTAECLCRQAQEAAAPTPSCAKTTAIFTFAAASDPTA